MWKFDLLINNVISPQIFDSELTAGVITDTSIYFACILMQKYLQQEWISERYYVIEWMCAHPNPLFLPHSRISINILVSLDVQYHWMYHITGCPISLDVQYHWMSNITGCTISLDVPYHWMYHITGCTISLDVPYHWMYHITGCTISLDVPYHWMYHITGCTISLDVPYHWMYHPHVHIFIY